MSEFVTEKPKTVCVKCQWHKEEDYHTCHHKPETRWSPIGGEQWVWRHRCVDINDGNCPHYAPKDEA